MISNAPRFHSPAGPPQLGINTPLVTYAECLVRDLQAPRAGERSGGNPLNYLYARAGCRDYANCVGYYKSRSITPVIPPPPTGPHKSQLPACVIVGLLRVALNKFRASLVSTVNNVIAALSTIYEWRLV